MFFYLNKVKIEEKVILPKNNYIKFVRIMKIEDIIYFLSSWYAHTILFLSLSSETLGRELPNAINTVLSYA